jgi:hypothetical protein
VFEAYGLSIVLAGLFLGSWLLQTWAGWQQFVAEQAQHGQAGAVFGPDGYIWGWLEATFENWQSEFLQLFTFVVLTVFLIHRSSHESRDGQDKLEVRIEEILQHVKRLEKALAAKES